jgi:hypothetical protein
VGRPNPGPVDERVPPLRVACCLNYRTLVILLMAA